MDGGPAAPIKVRKIERCIMALALRKQGASYRRIAAQLRQQPGISPKYSEGAAYEDVMTALRDLNKKQQELAEENRRLELERLDALWEPQFQKAAKGDPFALQGCLAIMSKRAALLGLNAPVTVNQMVTTVQVTADDLAQARDKANALEEAMLSGPGGAPPEVPPNGLLEQV